MATSTGTSTHLGPRIALGVELEHTRPGPASVADIAIALDVLTAIITDYPGETGPLSVDDTDVGSIGALVVLEYDGAPLIVGGGRGRVPSTEIASTIRGPLFSITHSACTPIAASAISAREGRLVLARRSSTCVAQITGTCAA